MFYSFTTKPWGANNTTITNAPTTYIECTTNSWNSTAELFFNIIYTSVAFVLPLIVLTFAHSKIYVKLKGNEELQIKRLTITNKHGDATSSSQKVADKNLMKARIIQARNRKVVRMLLVITISFVFCGLRGLWRVLQKAWWVTKICSRGKLFNWSRLCRSRPTFSYMCAWTRCSDRLFSPCYVVVVRRGGMVVTRAQRGM